MTIADAQDPPPPQGPRRSKKATSGKPKNPACVNDVCLYSCTAECFKRTKKAEGKPHV